MAETLTGPANSIVYEGTWVSGRFPLCAYGAVKCLIPPSDERASYTDTPASSEGYMTFDGFYLAGGCLKMAGDVTPGSTPPVGTTFTTKCNGQTCIELAVTSVDGDTINFSYTAHNPSDHGTMTLTKTDPEETELTVTPKPGKRFFRGLI